MADSGPAQGLESRQENDWRAVAERLMYRSTTRQTKPMSKRREKQITAAVHLIRLCGGLDNARDALWDAASTPHPLG